MALQLTISTALDGVVLSIEAMIKLISNIDYFESPAK
jgi:hypothetical protein